MKQRERPMRGFTRFDYAATMITGIELVHQIQKGPCDVTARCSSVMRSPQMWEAVRAACAPRCHRGSFAFALGIAPAP